MDWKTWVKQRIEWHTGVRIYRFSLPRGVDFTYDARPILVPDKMSVVFDVGANIGQYAERYKAVYPNARIYCFEPVSATYQVLKRRAASWRGVEVNQLAFGDVSGSKSIYLHPFSPVNSFINASAEGKKETVEVETLDEYCKKNSITNIDLIKIDVEGYETNVLRGATRMLSEHRIKSLYLESTPYPNHDSPHFVPLTEIHECLAPFGYSIFGIYEQEMDNFRDKNYLCYFNVAYILKELCNKRDGR